jgi:hypothetical protein
LEHTVREQLPELVRIAHERVRLDEPAERFWTDVAKGTADYFSLLLHNTDGRTGCVIWLDKNGLYKPAGRGGQITTDVRTINGIHVDHQKGIVRRLKQYMNHRGVFIVNDIAAALSEGVWENVGLENVACVSSFAIAPINSPGEPGDTKRLLGMLMVTTDGTDVIQPIHAEFLKSMADRFATYVMLMAVPAVPSSASSDLVVHMKPQLDFSTLFTELQDGQTLYWLDTFCPDFDHWLPDVKKAVKKGARIRMLVLDPDSDIARHRAKELEASFGEENFLRELKRFNKAVLQCQEECTSYRAGSMVVRVFKDLPGAPSYVICDERDEPIYGYSALFLVNPSNKDRHFYWSSQHSELKSHFRYFQDKWQKNDGQRYLPLH